MVPEPVVCAGPPVRSIPCPELGIPTDVFLVFFHYTIFGIIRGSLCTNGLFMLPLLFCMIFCMVGTGVEVIPTVQKIRHQVLRQPSQARIATADSKRVIRFRSTLYYTLAHVPGRGVCRDRRSIRNASGAFQ
jgi:hypothetical protein